MRRAIPRAQNSHFATVSCNRPTESYERVHPAKAKCASRYNGVPFQISKCTFYYSGVRQNVWIQRTASEAYHSFGRPTSTKWREGGLPSWSTKPTLRKKKKEILKKSWSSRFSQHIFAADLLSRFSQQIFSADLLSRSSQQIFSAIRSKFSQQIFSADLLSRFSRQIFSSDLLSRSSHCLIIICLLWSGVGGQLLSYHLLWSGVGGQLLSYHSYHLLWSGVGGQLLSYHSYHLLWSRVGGQLLSYHLLWSGVGGQLLSYHLRWSGVGGQLLSYHVGGLYCTKIVLSSFVCCDQGLVVSYCLIICCGQGLVVSYCLIILIICCGQGLVVSYCLISLIICCGQGLVVSYCLIICCGQGLVVSYCSYHLLWSGVGGQLLSYHVGGLYCTSSLEGPFRGAFGKTKTCGMTAKSHESKYKQILQPLQGFITMSASSSWALKSQGKVKYDTQNLDMEEKSKLIATPIIWYKWHRLAVIRGLVVNNTSPSQGHWKYKI